MSKKKREKTPETRKCAICGKAFRAKAVNQRYCSDKCKVAQKRRVERAKSAAADGAKKPEKKPVKPSVSVEVKKIDSPLRMFALAFDIIADAIAVVADRSERKRK